MSPQTVLNTRPSVPVNVTLMQTASSSAGEDQVKTDLRSEWAEPSMAYRCPYERDTHRETPLCARRPEIGVMLGTGLARASHRSRREVALISDSGPPGCGRGRFCCSGHRTCGPLSDLPQHILTRWFQCAGLLETESSRVPPHEHSHSWGSFLEVTGSGALWGQR